MSSIAWIIFGLVCFLGVTLFLVVLAHGIFFLFRARMFLSLLLMGFRMSLKRDKSIEMEDQGKV